MSARFQKVQPHDPGGEDSSRPELALVRNPEGQASEAPSRKPDPLLFLHFADLQPTQESILEFANKQGNLFNLKIVRVDEDSTNGQTVFGTSLRTWKLHISAMQRVLGVWQLLQAGEHERLRKHFRWETVKGHAELVFKSHPAKRAPELALGLEQYRTVLNTPPGPRPKRILDFDPISAAWRFLYEEIDQYIEHLESDFIERLEWDPPAKRFNIVNEARSLAAAIWYQAAKALAHDLGFERCRTCRAWIEIAPGVARSHRQFCSTGCRMKAYRLRISDAQAMHTAGKSIKEIASSLESDVSTVRKWITGMDEGR